MEKIDNTGWWTHTRWQLHFGDRHFGNIAHASRLPDRKEHELVDAKTIVISMIKHAVDGLSLLHDDTPQLAADGQCHEPGREPAHGATAERGELGYVHQLLGSVHVLLLAGPWGTTEDGGEGGEREGETGKRKW